MLMEMTTTRMPEKKQRGTVANLETPPARHRLKNRTGVKRGYLCPLVPSQASIHLGSSRDTCQLQDPSMTDRAIPKLLLDRDPWWSRGHTIPTGCCCLDELGSLGY